MQGQTNRTIRAERRARASRSEPTDAERRLWQYLRNRQVHGCKFRRQHPYRDFILDFVCLVQKLVIELDGGQHVEHARYDAYRTSVLERDGFRMLRFWNDDVLRSIEDVMDMVYRTIEARRRPPSPPQPSP